MGNVLRFTPSHSPAPRPDGTRTGQVVMFTGVRYQRAEANPPRKPQRRTKRKAAGE